jgi:hypothetical protein
MKRSYKHFILLFFILAIPLSATIGQDKKNERKVKVVIDEGSGTRTIIDTVMTADEIPKTITTATGSYYTLIGSPESDEEADNITITVTTDDDGNKIRKEKIIVIGGDKKGTWTAAAPKKGIYRVYIDSDEKVSDSEASKYIIARNGVVVTVESDNEEKARELVEDIREMLGVTTEDEGSD